MMSKTSPLHNKTSEIKDGLTAKHASGQSYRCRDMLQNCLQVGGTIFEGLTEQELQQADEFLHPLIVEQGDSIYQQGDGGEALLYLFKGRVKVDADNVYIGEIGMGGVLGEMALFIEGTRTATVTAVEDCRLLLLQPKDFDSLRESGNLLAWRLERAIVQSLSSRMRVMVDRIKEEMSAEDEMNSVKNEFSLLQRIKASLISFPRTKQAADLLAVEALRHSALFENEEPVVLEILGEFLQTEKHQPGDYLCKQGAKGGGVYFVLSGRVAVRMSLGATEGALKVAEVGPGAVLGLMDLADHQGCSADCVVESAVTSFSLNREAWQKLFSQDDKVGSAMRLAVIREFCKNLASANEYVGKQE